MGLFQKQFTWKLYIFPSLPLCISCFKKATGGLYLFCFTTNNFFPDCFAAFSIFSPSFTLMHKGFSHNTCILAANVFIACCACKPLGVQMLITSSSFSK